MDSGDGSLWSIERVTGVMSSGFLVDHSGYRVGDYDNLIDETGNRYRILDVDGERRKGNSSKEGVWRGTFGQNYLLLSSGAHE